MMMLHSWRWRFAHVVQVLELIWLIPFPVSVISLLANIVAMRSIISTANEDSRNY